MRFEQPVEAATPISWRNPGTCEPNLPAEHVTQLRRSQLIDRRANELYYSQMPVELTPAAARQLVDLPRVIRVRVTAVLERLEKWPSMSGAKPLRGKLAGKFRIRTGDYRLQFHVVGVAVVVERIGHRDGFYEE